MRQPRGIALAQAHESSDEALPQRQLLLKAGAAERDDPFRAADEVERFARIRLQRQVRERVLDPLRQRFHRIARRLPCRVDRNRSDRDAVAEVEQGVAAKAVLGRVENRRWDDKDVGTICSAAPEGDSRGAGLELLQSRFTVRGPLGENGDGASAHEQRPSGGEGLAILRSRIVVLRAIDRNRVETAREPSDQRHFEDRRLRQERDRPRREAEQEKWIDQSVRMIHRENHRPGRHLLPSNDLDAPEEDVRDEPEKWRDEAAHVQHCQHRPIESPSPRVLLRGEGDTKRSGVRVRGGA